MTKEEKRSAKKRQAKAAGVAVDELGAFDDFSHLYDVASSKAPDLREEKMRALKQYMNSIEQRGGQNEGGRKRKSADEDAPRRTLESRSEKVSKREAAAAAAAAAQGEEAGGGGGRRGGKKQPAALEEDPFYVEAAAAQQSRKQARAEKRERDLTERTAARGEAMAANTIEDDAEQRKATQKMIKNRGLTRQRKKEDKNPRSKNREKFRKATIRRKGAVRSVAVQEGAYGGEATGIKKNVSHSTRFPS